MKLSLIAVLAVATCWLAGAAHAQDGVNINTVNQQALVNLVQASGNTGQPVDLGDGVSPAVEVRTQEGQIFLVVGTACENGGCRGIKLLAQYTPQGTVSVQQINELNRDVAPLKIWYAENVMVMERYLVLNGGVSQANLAFEVNTFPAYLTAVINRVNQGAANNNGQ